MDTKGHRNQELAQFIEGNKHAIITQWLEEVDDNIPAMRGVGKAEVVDHLAQVIDEIVETLIQPDRLNSIKANKVSLMHGRERISFKGIAVGDLVQEYILLRKVLVGFCTSSNVGDRISDNDISIILEYASLSAVNEFSRGVEESERKLLSTLVHDMRSPLASAINYSQLISLGHFSETEQKEALRTINKNLKRALSMMEELLDAEMHKSGRGLVMRFATTDLNECLKPVCHEASLLYDKEIVTSFPERPAVGAFDLALITRTLENLISNAVKYGSPGGKITLTLEDSKEAVTLKVHNPGRPIPEKDMKEMFEFFHRTRRKRVDHSRGWGLGLTLIKTVAESHGGEVIAESNKQTGTTFGMKLLKNFRKDGEEFTVLL